MVEKLLISRYFKNLNQKLFFGFRCLKTLNGSLQMSTIDLLDIIEYASGFKQPLKKGRARYFRSQKLISSVSVS